ncbi:MAG: hypothetical protein AAF968_11030, partial [Pseudomonadota bacterium]
MTEPETFAERFGRLITRYIEAKGWTLQTVCFEVWGKKGVGRESHVSAYMKGTRGKPSKPTQDLFQKALGISDEELEACRVPPASAKSRGVVSDAGVDALTALKLEDAVFFRLAAQFGHDNPRAKAPEYMAFLEQKAEEFRALEARLASLSEMEEEAAARARLDNQLKAARAAIAEGAFGEADEILAAAEEVQQAEHTLREVRRQAALRTTRGEAALLNGDADTAHTHFAKAAAMFDPFDEDEGLNQRHTLGLELYKHGLRYGGSGLAGAISLWRDCADRAREEKRPAAWAAAQSNLGAALRNQGERTGGEAGAALLGEAVAAFRAALRVRTEDAHPLQWATTQNNLGAALGDQGARMAREVGVALLGEAVAAYRA